MKRSPKEEALIDSLCSQITDNTDKAAIRKVIDAAYDAGLELGFAQGQDDCDPPQNVNSCGLGGGEE